MKGRVGRGQGEVAGDAGEQVHVGLANRFREDGRIARLHVEVLHRPLLSNPDRHAAGRGSFSAPGGAPNVALSKKIGKYIYIIYGM